MRLCSQCKTLLTADARTCPRDGANADDVETLPKEARLGVYRIVRVLGEGGMGFVYEAVHDVLHRRTAIKLLRPEFAARADVVTRFLNEAKAVNVIDHQNIVNIYDYGDGSEGAVYFVMEYLDGETLDDLMRKHRPMPPALLLHVFGQILKALAAAHAKQIVHRDLKPANVLVVARDDNWHFIKVLDFGIAQLRGAGSVKGLTVAGAIMGTPQYMSPEQVAGADVDARSDVWALGVMLYKAACGSSPFGGEQFGEIAAKILGPAPQRPSEVAPDAKIAKELDDVIASCLTRDLAKRCASIKEMQAGLERVAAAYGLDAAAIAKAARGETASLPLPVQRAVPAPAAPKSKLPIAIALGGIVAIAGIIAYVAIGRGGGRNNDAPPPPPPAAATGSNTPATIKSRLAAGDLAAVRDLARAPLHDAIATGDSARQLEAVDALALVASPELAPLLYDALAAGPEARVRSARTLATLALPDAAPKLRAALQASGDRVRVELAAPLLQLGDADARAIVQRALAEPATRVTAAVALADAGDAAAKPVLADAFATLPKGGEAWRRAAAALVKLGDGNARDALAAELALPDSARAVAAANVLARAGDDKARAYLGRVVADAGFARRGAAAVALARAGDRAAIDWVPTGLASADADDRKFAIATCAMLGGGDKYAVAIATAATDDPDRGVRFVADAALLVPATTRGGPAR